MKGFVSRAREVSGVKAGSEFDAVRARVPARVLVLVARGCSE